MDVGQLEKILKEANQPAYRLNQIKKAIFTDGASSFSEISNIPLDLRNILEKKIEILPFKVKKIFVSKDERAIKALLILKDKNLIETVLISPKPDIRSVCVSSQVGCPLNCQFCATGKVGFKRNLSADEIFSQVLFWRQYLKQKNSGAGVTDIVYMGMGEPFLNWENVKQSLATLISPKLFGFGSRSISVSTVGVPEGIEKFSREFSQMNLAISLHFADDEKRSQFVPANKKYNLKKIKEVLKSYFQKNRRKVFIEYIMLAGINDGKEDAEKLADFIHSIENEKLLHINLIRFNSIGGELKPSSREKVKKFAGILKKLHISCTIRKSLGDDIHGACGQLAGR